MAASRCSCVVVLERGFAAHLRTCALARVRDAIVRANACTRVDAGAIVAGNARYRSVIAVVAQR